MMRKTNRVIAGILTGVLLLAAVPVANAATSEELKSQLDALVEKQSGIQAQMDALKEKENANWSSTEEMVAQKNNIDQQMFLLYSQLDTLEEQIMEYSQLIAQNQQDLDAAEQRLSELNEQNKERIRCMEEEGKMSYWSVIFKAKDFTDLIDRLSMVREIAEADARMLDELDEAAKEVARVQEELVSQKASLEQSRADQIAAQKELEQKRSEADEILNHLNAERYDLEDAHAAIDAENNAMLAEIAASEKAFNEQRQREKEEEERRKREEEERRRQEEEERRKEEEAQKEQEEANKPKPEPEDEEEPEKPTEPEREPEPEHHDSGWLQPCDYVYISSPYGPRHGGWHNGVDFAAYRGTPIHATRSGTVTKARSMTTSYGNHVVINHGDGFSSLYAHMDYFVVSNGEYVHQGDVIGYVGSTGNSTGNHLHFTIMYNGDDVNPMKYL